MARYLVNHSYNFALTLRLYRVIQKSRNPATELCNIWHHWSLFMTHSLWWYCEAIRPAPFSALFTKRAACRLFNCTLFWILAICTVSGHIPLQNWLTISVRVAMLMILLGCVTSESLCTWETFLMARYSYQVYKNPWIILNVTRRDKHWAWLGVPQTYVFI